MKTRSKIAPARPPLRRLSICLAFLVSSLIPALRPARAQQPVDLKIRNTDAGNATVEIRSLQSLTPNNPWRTVPISSGRVQTLPIASPDDYIVRASVGGVTYQSKPIPLKKWVQGNPNFELNLSRLAAAPQGVRPPIYLGLRFAPPKDNRGEGEYIEFERVDRRGRPIPDPAMPGGSPGNVGSAGPRR